MLVFTRNVGEAIQIDSDIKVTVLGVDGNQVRIGLEAPPHISIDRDEVFQRKLKEGLLLHAVAPVKSGNKTVPVLRKKSPIARLFGRHVR